MASISSIRQNYPLVGYTYLTLTDKSLQVEQRRLFNLTKVELPFEELMPIGVAHHHSIPFRLPLVALFISFGCLKSLYSIYAQPNQRESAIWLLLILTGILLALIYQILRDWHHDFVLTTGRGNIVLFDSRRKKATHYEFANELRDRTILYLRHHYTDINPLLPAEPQLARLEWLRERGVLNTTQFHQLKTRLLGRFYNEELLPGQSDSISPSAN
ncbi:hypothetical protein [Hymenobacter sp. BT730]|uniref:hypothetical protein n=1 Tax=Hymenobacter sp. BT730 TaxID=3063332 RepID=UPI0026DFBFEA|nr:hypothetical protein [Hymenobacter sp. BT730]